MDSIFVAGGTADAIPIWFVTAANYADVRARSPIGAPTLPSTACGAGKGWGRHAQRPHSRHCQRSGQFPQREGQLISAGHAFAMSAAGAQRTYGVQIGVANDPGCVKTFARDEGAELFSLLSSLDSGRQCFCFSN